MWAVTSVSWTNIEVHNFRESVWLDLLVRDTNNYRNELTSCVKMKINFMCPTGWFMECLRIWLNIISGCVFDGAP